MPSLPDLPSKNPALIDSAVVNALYAKATREYVNRQFSASLETIATLRSQQSTNLKTQKRIFFLYLTVVDTICKLDDVELKAALGRSGHTIADQLKQGTIWNEAESYFGKLIPIDISVHIILALTRHIQDPSTLQTHVESLLTSLDPESADYDSISELYALHVLPRCQEWDSASGFIEAGTNDEKREAWLKTLSDIQVAQEREAAQRAQELEDAKKAESDAKRLKKIRKSRASKKASTHGSVNESVPEKPEEDSVAVVNRDQTSKTLLQRWHTLVSSQYNTQILRVLFFLALLFGATGRRAIRERIQRSLSQVGRTLVAAIKTTYI